MTEKHYHPHGGKSNASNVLEGYPNPSNYSDNELFDEITRCFELHKEKRCRESSPPIPPGYILGWDIESNPIPDGWHLCDGIDNTPDLTGKLTFGLSEYPPGTVFIVKMEDRCAL